MEQLRRELSVEEEESSEDLGDCRALSSTYQNYRLEMKSQELDKSQQEAKEKVEETVSAR